MWRLSDFAILLVTIILVVFFGLLGVTSVDAAIVGTAGLSVVVILIGWYSTGSIRSIYLFGSSAFSLAMVDAFVAILVSFTIIKRIGIVDFGVPGVFGIVLDVISFVAVGVWIIQLIRERREAGWNPRRTISTIIGEFLAIFVPVLLGTINSVPRL